MSTDEQVSVTMIQNLNDSKNAYEQAIDQLKKTDDDEDVGVLRHAVDQRTFFAQELDDLAAAYGDSIKNEGSAAGKAMTGLDRLKAKIIDSSSKTILMSCAKGDEDLIGAYQAAIAEDISDPLRKILQFQLGKVQEMHTTITTVAS